MITRKKIEIDLKFHGTGKIENPHPGCYSGGVVDPKISNEVIFTMYRQELDEDGIWSPVPCEKSVKECFQLNLTATSKGYKELGRYFLSLSEIDSNKDPNYHEHFDDVDSIDKHTKIDLVFRKTTKTEIKEITNEYLKEI